MTTQKKIKDGPLKVEPGAKARLMEVLGVIGVILIGFSLMAVLLGTIWFFNWVQDYPALWPYLVYGLPAVGAFFGISAVVKYVVKG